ncbi:hypothetical protein DPMN_084650 [Dreissena polymorpha]|uniref:Uncharacterized protein n=1 Tax=Dreissena polymorpha TaxID=45954 RepID=A0A9D4BC71_DREPO|nr:hypothetical protein DPMN_084650 [Dreissena polymorpha]
MAGKYVQTALLRYFCVDKCPHSKLISGRPPDSDTAYLGRGVVLFHSYERGDADVSCSDIYIKLETATERKKHKLAQTTKTSQLMLNYHLMVSKARMLIKAGGTGCWMMPLQAVSNCLSVFAASGYFTYLRSAYNYLQPTSSQYETHPDEVS